MTTLRALVAPELREAAALAAAAFAEDPSAVHLAPGAGGRRERLERVFLASLSLDASCGAEILGAWDGPLLGFASWFPAGKGPAGVRGWLAAAPRFASLLRWPGLCLRGLALESALSASRPGASHAYLRTLAVSPAAQGRGVGKALVAAVTERAAGAPVWLETFNPDNRAYYAARGFSAQAEWRRGSLPPFWTFRRDGAGRVSGPR